MKMRFIAKNFDELTAGQWYEIAKARMQVFMLEQGIICQDMDGVDYFSRHYFLEEDGRVLAYLRAFYADESKQTVQIGRVLSITHGIGLGAELMREALRDIWDTMGCRKITLHSQKHAEGFYEKLGFYPVSDEFLEEGVVHITMQLDRQ